MMVLCVCIPRSLPPASAWRLRSFPPPRRVPGEWAAPFQTALSLTCPPRLSLSPPSSTAAFLLARATSFFCLFLPRARKPSAGFRPTRQQLFREEGSNRRGELVGEARPDVWGGWAPSGGRGPGRAEVQLEGPWARAPCTPLTGTPLGRPARFLTGVT